MKDSHWPVFTNVKTNSRRVKFLSSRSFGNLLTLFCIGIAVSGLMLRLKAKEFSKDPEFKVSLGWYQKWKRRHSVSLRTKTTLTQRLPVKCHRFVITSPQRHGYSLSRIFNMDETLMWFELPPSRTLEFSGNRTVPVKSCGAEKQSFTVTLTNGFFRGHHILKS